MNVQQIRTKARALQVSGYSRMTKAELIRAVQLAEGNTDCFQRIAGCGQDDCCWQSDCQATH